MAPLPRFASVLVFTLLAMTVAGPSASPEAPEPVGEIPFTLERARVMVPVRLGDSPPLRVILDTGMPIVGVYLFHRDDRRWLPDAEFTEVRVPGAGADEPSHAVMADSLSFRAGDLTFTGQMVVISTSPSTQTFPSDGVIGATLLQGRVVEIDYEDLVIRFHDPERFTAPAGWTRLPMTLQKDVPFVDAAVSVAGEEPVPIRVYLDSASGDALELMVSETAPFPVPEGLEQVYLGTGLSGDVHGGVGRVAKLKLGPHELADVVTLFPPEEVRSKQEGADGILGDDVLRRFHVILDYAHGALYLRPNRSFAEPFERTGN